MRHSFKRSIAWPSMWALVAVAGCATPASTPSPDYDAMALSMIKSSFSAQGQATLDRLEQDPLQHACSSDTPPTADVASRLEAHELAPTDAHPGCVRRGPSC